MTTDPATGTPTGIIGARPLVAVQTFGIARLTSDPIALIPGTFVAVTGRGPKDSNESGKTSFLAAVSLLLGDPEWQATGNGTANTATLLFEPIVAGASAQLVGAADRGYVVGLFAEAGKARPHTVWLQISSDRPHLQVRHQPGVHLLTEGDDDERHRAAPEFFRQLGGRPLGSSEYAQHLYGRSPKVLAYVASRGQVRSRPSLLKLEAATYTPDRIGEALLTLSGRSSVLERDRQQRRELADRRGDYARALTQHDIDLAREDQLLEAVALREDLRAKLGSAWRTSGRVWRGPCWTPSHGSAAPKHYSPPPTRSWSQPATPWECFGGNASPTRTSGRWSQQYVPPGRSTGRHRRHGSPARRTSSQLSGTSPTPKRTSSGCANWQDGMQANPQAS